MITREHALWAYRLFLDREPENERVLDEWLDRINNTKELRSNFMLSPEFGHNNRELVFAGDANVVIKEIGHGLRLFVDLSDHVIGWGVVRGQYETQEINFVRRTVQPKQTVLDIGAHIGLFTIITAALVGSAGKVYAFEPLEAQQSLLQSSVKENGFSDRVVLERAAVSDKPGEGQMVVPEFTVNTGGAYLLGSGAQVRNGHTTSVAKLIKLDEYPLRRPVNFIKIDVEGAEPLALRGAANILRADRPIVLSELHPTQLQRVSGYKPENFISEMETYGYETYALSDHGPEPFDDGDSAEIRSIVFLPKHK